MLQHNSGALALVGSGEYTVALEETDRQLIATLDGPARVVLIPTASALEPGMPQHWNEQGVAHFGRLGVQVTPLHLLTRADAHDPQIVALLGAANFFYFSGGSPDHLIEILHKTPAWSTIDQAHAQGAVLAGCSAGAMILGSYLLSVRAVARGEPPRWRQAFGVAAGIVVMPHFDRIAGFAGPELFAAILVATPARCTLVGIDEDTALLRLPGGDWQVTGRRTVSVFAANGGCDVYQAGEIVRLPAGVEDL